MSINVHVIRCNGAPTAAPTLEGQHWIDTVTGNIWLSNGTASVANWVLFSPDTDVKVKVSAADTTSGYLNDELTVSNGTNATSPLEKSITSPAGDEKLNLKFDQTKIIIVASQVSDFTEAVQDAIGSALTDTSSIDFTYNDAGNVISAVVLPGGVDHNALLNWVANKHIDHSAVSLIAGTGISATGLGDITASRTINLANTSVTAAAYGSASQVSSFTVNAQGQLTAAANVAIAIASTAVTDFAEAVDDRVAALLQAGTGISLSYNDPANTLTISASGAALSDEKVKISATDTTADYLSAEMTAGVGLTKTILNPSANEQLEFKITNTAVTAAAYGSATQVPSYTVNAQGQLTAAANVAIAIPSTAVTDFAEAVDDRVAALIIPGLGITSTYNDAGNALTIAASGSAGRYVIYADQMDSPNNANWTINALAPASADSTNAALVVRRFDDTAEEGIGFMVQIPTGATNIIISPKGRAQTAPGTAKQVILRLYTRQIPDNAAISAWSAATQLTAIDIPITNAYFQYDTQTISLATLGLTANRETQFELTRHGANASDTLVGDYALLSLTVEFT
jgi:hypothetical protein